MLRSSLTSMGVVLIGTAAFAQSNLSRRDQPIIAPVKNAGVLHLGTGTWTHSPSGQALLTGPEIVYNNTCNSGYYGGMSQGEIFTDEGAIPDTGQAITPSTSIAGAFDTYTGCQATYDINGFQIAYCTWQPVFTATIAFFDNYEAVGTTCAVPGAPTASFAITGLPASTASGVQACWIVSLDLAAQVPPQNFTLTGTGNNPNLFGWSWAVTSPTLPAPNTDGPLIKGVPGTCSGTDGTIFDHGTASVSYPGNYTQTGNFPVDTDPGTGMLSANAFRLDGVTAAPGCYIFTAAPFASFHLELYSDPVCAAPEPGTAFCFPTVSGVIACPCGNNPVSPDRGCDNSLSTGGARLDATGIGSVTNDTVQLLASGERPNVLSIFLQGNSLFANGVPFGDGVRCAGGQLLRLNTGGTNADAGGNVTYPDPGHTNPITVQAQALGQPIFAGDIRYYQTYYRDPNLVFCPPPQGNSWNVTSAYEIVWQP